MKTHENEPSTIAVYDDLSQAEQAGPAGAKLCGR